MLAAFMVVAVPAWNLWRTTSGAEWYAAGMYTLAEVKLVLGYEPGTGQEIRFPDGTRRVLTIREIASSVAGLGGARADQGGDVRERMAGREGRARRHRPLPRLVLVPRRAALAPPPHPGRGAGDGGRAAPPGAPRPSQRARPDAGLEGAPALPHRRHSVPRAHRDPAHHRLGHHRVREDGADLGPGGSDPGQGRALRDLRQDGELHRGILRRRPRRADEPAGCARAALVAVPGSPQPPRLRHDGGRADPAAEGHRRSLLGDRGAPALLQRRRGVLEAGGDREQSAGRPSPEDRPDGARRGDGRHGRAVHRRSGKPEDRALGARHVDRAPERA